MFDEKQKKEYFAIKAPDRLQKRIAHSLIRRRMALKRQWAAAACLTLVAAVALLAFWRSNDASVALSYDGAPIAQEAVTVSGGAEKAVYFGQKTIVPSGIPLFADAGKNTKLSVSGGSIQVFRADGELLAVGSDVTINEPCEIRWNVADLPSGCYSLSLGNEVYEITIDAARGEMFILKK